ncbi:MAG: hypothetical protein QXG58_05065 [Candidatus Bathyarchaeia archaeon]
MEMVKDIFEVVDKKISDCDFDFGKLADIYRKWLDCIKKKTGTSGGFTGLSEYLIFKTILLYLEQKLEIRFKPKRKTKYAYFFVSTDGQILVTHATSIDNYMEKAADKLGKISWSDDETAKKLRPDIVIFKKLTDNHYKPEAIIQIKVYAVNPQAIKGEVEKIKKIASVRNGKPLLAIIFFFEPATVHKEELQKEFAYIITPKEPSNFKRMLREIESKLLPAFKL